MKCNFTIFKKNSDKYPRIFEKYITRNDKRAFVIINSKITNNFMLRKLINKHKTTTKFKKNSYNLMIINENSLSNDDKQIKHKTALITLMMNNYEKILFFDIVRIINHDIVLKFFWLRHYNSFIDWIKKQFKFECCNHIITNQFTHRQRTMMNEKQNIKHIVKQNFAISIKNNDKNRFNSRNIE